MKTITKITRTKELFDEEDNVMRFKGTMTEYAILKEESDGIPKILDIFSKRPDTAYRIAYHLRELLDLSGNYAYIKVVNGWDDTEEIVALDNLSIKLDILLSNCLVGEEVFIVEDDSGIYIKFLSGQTWTNDPTNPGEHILTKVYVYE